MSFADLAYQANALVSTHTLCSAVHFASAAGAKARSNQSTRMHVNIMAALQHHEVKGAFMLAQSAQGKPACLEVLTPVLTLVMLPFDVRALTFKMLLHVLHFLCCPLSILGTLWTLISNFTHGRCKRIQGERLHCTSRGPPLVGTSVPAQHQQLQVNSKCSTSLTGFVILLS